MIGTPCVTVHSGSLGWGVKQSFLGYLARTPRSEVSVGGGARYQTNRFEFPLAGATEFDAVTSVGVLRFTGDVRFIGHSGFLDVTLADPWVELGPATGILSVASDSLAAPGRVELATLDPPTRDTVGQRLSWDAVPTRLTQAGVAIFNNVYARGESFDPIYLNISTLPIGLT